MNYKEDDAVRKKKTAGILGINNEEKRLVEFEDAHETWQAKKAVKSIRLSDKFEKMNGGLSNPSKIESLKAGSCG